MPLLRNCPLCIPPHPLKSFCLRTVLHHTSSWVISPSLYLCLRGSYTEVLVFNLNFVISLLGCDLKTSHRYIETDSIAVNKHMMAENWCLKEQKWFSNRVSAIKNTFTVSFDGGNMLAETQRQFEIRGKDISTERIYNLRCTLLRDKRHTKQGYHPNRRNTELGKQPKPLSRLCH